MAFISMTTSWGVPPVPAVRAAPPWVLGLWRAFGVVTGVTTLKADVLVVSADRASLRSATCSSLEWSEMSDAVSSSLPLAAPSRDESMVKTARGMLLWLARIACSISDSSSSSSSSRPGVMASPGRPSPGDPPPRSLVSSESRPTEARASDRACDSISTSPRTLSCFLMDAPIRCTTSSSPSSSPDPPAGFPLNSGSISTLTSLDVSVRSRLTSRSPASASPSRSSSTRARNSAQSPNVMRMRGRSSARSQEASTAPDTLCCSSRSQ